MGVAKLGYIHTNPDISETAYFFTGIGLLSKKKSESGHWNHIVSP